MVIQAGKFLQKKKKITKNSERNLQNDFDMMDICIEIFSCHLGVRHCQLQNAPNNKAKLTLTSKCQKIKQYCQKSGPVPITLAEIKILTNNTDAPNAMNTFGPDWQEAYCQSFIQKYYVLLKIK